MGYLDLDMKLNKKLGALRQTAREFGRDIVRPAGIELDKLENPADVIADESVLWDVFRGFRERGLHRAMIPKAFGGMIGDLPPMALPIVNEQVGYADGGLAVSMLVAGMPFAFAIMSGHREIRNWARDFVNDKEGKMIGCWAITEPDHGTDWVMGTCKAGSDPRLAPGLTATKKGDEYILHGWKSAWVSNGTIATHAVLHVGLDASKGVHGSGIALCPLDLPGISRNAPLNKVGQRALNQGEIIFDEVKLPKKYMLISVPGIFGANTFGHTFLGLANSSMGVTFAGQAQATLDETLKFAYETKRNGSLLADQEDIKIRLFRMFAKVEAARTLALRTSHHFMTMATGGVSRIGTPYRATFWALGNALEAFFKACEKYEMVREWTEAFTHPTKTNELMEWGKYGVASKITATETAYDVARDALQIFGEEAMSPKCPVDKMLRDARASMIEDGANDALAIAAFEGV